MPRSFPASAIRVVRARSSGLGEQSPDRVVMNEDQAGGVQENGTFEDFSRVDDRGAECAHCHMIHPDGHMFCIEKESIKMFAILVFADVFEVSVDVFRRLAPSLGVERRCGLFDKTDGVARNRRRSRELVLSDCSSSRWFLSW
jgi:hypothetical protein